MKTPWSGTLLLTALCSWATATEYFVAPDGDDEADGLSREQPFASVQRGVDALETGDTLTLLPGEYFGSVRREDLGGPEAVTTIRAEIPGTVILRGDIPLLDWEPVDGYRFIYQTQVEPGLEVHTVNELDTLTILEKIPQRDLLEFVPGSFYLDRENGLLYLSTPDLASPEHRRYTASVTGDHGLNLVSPTKVVIEGLAVTGFNRNEMAPREDRSQYATWGFLTVNGKECVIRDSRAFLNGRGIQVNSQDEAAGDNEVEGCKVWANASQYSSGDTGGITLHFPRRDLVRGSVSFLNANYGMNIRSEAAGAPDVDDDGNPVFSQEHHDNKSHLIDNLAWGNLCDFKIKVGHAYLHEVRKGTGPGLWSVRPDRVSHSLIGPETSRSFPIDNLQVRDPATFHSGLDFADPVHHDYRLQSTSRFRGTGPDGEDAGPTPFDKTVYFVSPDGDDDQNGFSLSTAWRNFEYALSRLNPGDTLYLAEGVYTVESPLTLAGASDQPIFIRGRGDDRVVIETPVALEASQNLEFSRLEFQENVQLSNSGAITFDNCAFHGPDQALQSDSTGPLRVTQSLFSRFSSVGIRLSESPDVFLQGNIYNNTKGVAVSSDGPVRYSDYHAYANPERARSVDGGEISLGNLPEHGERHSFAAIPELDEEAPGPKPSNLAAFSTRGPFHKAVGRHRFMEKEIMHLQMAGPFVHSVTDTTANLEWWTSGPTGIQLRWGDTRELEHEVNRLSHRAGNFSLTGLEPDTTYYFQITLDHPVTVTESAPVTERDEKSVTLSFTTAAEPPQPGTYYVAPDGDNANDGLERDSAWRSISHAAAQVRAGDTVLIAGGTYTESVRIRATGAEGLPITFKAVPGEKVILDGLERTLEYAFLATDKKHLHFDAFYLKGFAQGSGTVPWADTERGRNGAFVFYHADDVAVTRCFFDPRGPGTAGGLMYARHCHDLLVQNCVISGSMTGMDVWWESANLRVENNVFLRNFIRNTGFHIRWVDEPAIVRKNIFTDNLLKKVHVPPNSVSDKILDQDNCYFVRVPPSERAWSGELSLAEYLEHQNEQFPEHPSFAADPEFAVAAAIEVEDPPEDFYIVDRIYSAFQDFPDLFATNPEVADRGIGLQPEAFADFHFHE